MPQPSQPLCDVIFAQQREVLAQNSELARVSGTILMGNNINRMIKQPQKSES